MTQNLRCCEVLCKVLATKFLARSCKNPCKDFSRKPWNLQCKTRILCKTFSCKKSCKDLAKISFLGRLLGSVTQNLRCCEVLCKVLATKFLARTCKNPCKDFSRKPWNLPYKTRILCKEFSCKKSCKDLAKISFRGRLLGSVTQFRCCEVLCKVLATTFLSRSCKNPCKDFSRKPWNSAYKTRILCKEFSCKKSCNDLAKISFLGRLLGSVTQNLRCCEVLCKVLATKFLARSCKNPCKDFSRKPWNLPCKTTILCKEFSCKKSCKDFAKISFLGRPLAEPQML